MKNIIIPALFIFLTAAASGVFVSASCSNAPIVREKAVVRNHPNLRRFRDHQVNQIIIGAWENMQKRNYESAGLDFERLTRKGYTDDDILFGAGIAYYRQNDLRKAKRYSTDALDKNPNHFEARYLRALVNRDLNLVSAFRDDLRALLSMSYTKPLVCGLYFTENDLADEMKFKRRVSEARSLLGQQ
jgi:tetratricopeptide (TPR) repeat protein